MLRPGPLPLSERTFRSRRSKLSSALSFSVSERPSTYKLWTDEKLRKAYEEVNGGHLSVRRAAELYGVPKSTLSDRVTGRVEFGSHSGPARYLSDAEEEELVSFLCGAARLGYARTKRDVLAVVKDVVAIKSFNLQRMVGSFQEKASLSHSQNCRETVLCPLCCK